MSELLDMRWRTGRRVGRTIYAQLGPQPSGRDPLIGVMDTGDLADSAVEGHNQCINGYEASPTAEIAGLHAVIRRLSEENETERDWRRRTVGHNDYLYAEVQRLNARVAELEAILPLKLKWS